MSSEPPNGPDTEPINLGSGERRRAAIALGVLAVAAVALVAVMVYAFGSGGGAPTSPTHVADPTGPAVTVTGAPSQPPHSSSSHHHPPRTSAGSTAPSQPPTSSGPVSCPTSSPCSLPDDVGNAVGALNDYRTAHGVSAVSGSVTKAAQDCALANGDESSCPSGYFWEPVPKSGKQVIDKIAAQGSGPAWLLDKTVKSVEVGWVFIPSSHSFEVAMVADH